MNLNDQTQTDENQTTDLSQMENITPEEFHNLSDNDKVMFNNMYPDKFQKEESSEKIFGKFASIDEAKKGYDNAVRKITEQGKELNEYKQNYKPVEDYSSENWNKRIDEMIENKLIPESINLDPDIPEVSMLMNGLQKAGVTENQVKNIINGVIEKQKELVESKKESFLQEIGEEGKTKINEISKVVSRMNEIDQIIVSELLAVPYVNKEQLDFFHRMLCNGGELNLPSGTETVHHTTTAADIYKQITEFNEKHGNSIMYNPDLQKEEARLWEEYGKLKSSK